MNNLATLHWQTIKKMEKEMKIMRKEIHILQETVIAKDQEIQVLKKRNEELEEENRKLKGTGTKLKKIIFKEETKSEEENKRGAKKNHQSFTRKKPTEEEITVRKEILLTQCPCCNTDLINKKPYSFTKRYGTDIPLPVSPIVTEYSIGKYKCQNCKKWVQGNPKELFGKSPFGINLMMLVLHMKYRGRATDEHIKETLEKCYKIDLSNGALHSILNRTTELFGSHYEVIKQAIQEGKHVHADETGWRVEGENWYAWTFTNDKAVLYSIENTRGGGIPKKILEGFNGVLIRDGYQGYDQINGEHQICIIHFLRRAKELAEAEKASEEVKNFHTHMKWLFRKARKLHKKCKTPEERMNLYHRMLRALQQSWKGKTYTDTQLESTRKWWLEKRHQHLLTFLKYENIPWENNEAERAVRPVVIRRKVSGGSRSKRGAEREAINMSCIHTIIKQGKSLFEEISKIWKTAG
jgi:hypothetical protein